jgi:hypothetical protein
MKRAAPIAIFLATLAPARAQATNPDAQSFFAQGRKLRQEGDCERAIVAFRHALETAPEGLGALRNIAECEEQLGRFASARNDWWGLRRAVLQSNDPKYDGWDKDAAGAYARLEGKVGKLIVRLRGEDLDRVTVTIDGQPLDPRLLGVDLERDLGPHSIEAAYGGAAPIVEKRTLVAGTRLEVMLAIPERSKRPVGPPPEPPSKAMRNGGFVAIGVGGLAAIAMGVSAGVRASALSTIASKCPGYATGEICDASLRGDRDRGRTAATLVNVFAGVAIAGLGAGIPLAIVGSRSSAPVATVGIAPAAGGAAAWATVRF